MVFLLLLEARCSETTSSSKISVNSIMIVFFVVVYVGVLALTSGEWAFMLLSMEVLGDSDCGDGRMERLTSLFCCCGTVIR